ncbi:hypothetical protein B0H15DRAFT_506271 [Mycena belliarum]|uniref:Uncharacterized protein n=1 Tax=Mycena belliarum TaxID=1033014 RepID=A0AAD6UDQ6_9AGAR|nr:hypothetical protein B0H15DRAFT_506271 [Mycena belliae]
MHRIADSGDRSSALVVPELCSPRAAVRSFILTRPSAEAALVRRDSTGLWATGKLWVRTSRYRPSISSRTRSIGRLELGQTLDAFRSDRYLRPSDLFSATQVERGSAGVPDASEVCCAGRIGRTGSAARGTLPNAAHARRPAHSRTALRVRLAARSKREASSPLNERRRSASNNALGAGRGTSCIRSDGRFARASCEAQRVSARRRAGQRHRTQSPRARAPQPTDDPQLSTLLQTNRNVQDLCSAAQWSGAARPFRGGLRQQDSARTRGDSSARPEAGSRARTTSAHSRTGLRGRLAARALSPLSERERAGSGKASARGADLLHQRDPERRHADLKRRSSTSQRARRAEAAGVERVCAARSPHRSLPRSPEPSQRRVPSLQDPPRPVDSAPSPRPSLASLESPLLIPAAPLRHSDSGGPVCRPGRFAAMISEVQAGWDPSARGFEREGVRLGGAGWRDGRRQRCE